MSAFAEQFGVSQRPYHARHRSVRVLLSGQRGFSFVELLAVLVLIVLGGAVVLILVTELAGPRHCGARQMKDASQISFVQQALIAYAEQNYGDYPRPSLVDVAHTTIEAPAASKDTTANIFSILVWGGYISSEFLISPAELNERITQHLSYAKDNPVAANKPASALWDPAFSANFASAKGGNISYAHLQPAGERRKLWRNSYAADVPIVGNRGPEITGVEYGSATDEPTCSLARPNSNTFLIHGSPKLWEGNVAYADGHVAFEVSLAPGAPKLISVNSRLVRDTLFFDETDPAAAQNAFLGIFTTAGETPADFTAIWD